MSEMGNCYKLVFVFVFVFGRNFFPDFVIDILFLQVTVPVSRPAPVAPAARLSHSRIDIYS